MADLKRLAELTDADLWDKLGTNEVPWFNGADELHKRLLKVRGDYETIGHAALNLREELARARTAHAETMRLLTVATERLTGAQGEASRLRAEILGLRSMVSEVRKALHTLHLIVFPREGQHVDPSS